ncbi:Na+/H+ antiporter NhaA, partial [uncultured Campylobacter sp.]|uniref:Na+/H+ antiporter NhaA n=1 Tax=uncultured Campylobacter sp. TaxID=218934 RepID=UPI0026124D2E
MQHIIKKILSSESSAGVILLLSAVFAILAQNVDFLSKYYEAFLHLSFTIGVGSAKLDESMHFLVNDVLMAIFFFAIGLELKREKIEGQLRHFSQILLPSFAALGGVMMPAIIFSIINWGDAVAMKGWAIPTATDIAFAVGVMALLGKKIPASLKIFVLTLAIMDDLCAILIIALFYS